ncbi:MAG: hypothetical protein GY756_22250 [bacterium]|nr:hypothetical protein [bacterium]
MKKLLLVLNVILLTSLNSVAGTDVDASGSYYEKISAKNPQLVNEAYDLKSRHDTLTSGSNSNDNSNDTPSYYTKSMLESMNLNKNEIKKVLKAQDRIKNAKTNIVNITDNIANNNTKIEKKKNDISLKTEEITSLNEKVIDLREQAKAESRPWKKKQLNRQANNILKNVIPKKKSYIRTYERNIKSLERSITTYNKRIDKNKSKVTNEQDKIDGIIGQVQT